MEGSQYCYDDSAHDAPGMGSKDFSNPLSEIIEVNHRVLEAGSKERKIANEEHNSNNTLLEARSVEDDEKACEPLEENSDNSSNDDGGQDGIEVDTERYLLMNADERFYQVRDELDAVQPECGGNVQGCNSYDTSLEEANKEVDFELDSRGPDEENGDISSLIVEDQDGIEVKSGEYLQLKGF